MNKIIITIDGHAGSGKSSTAHRVSKILRYKYINSGYLYRAITFSIIDQNIDQNDSDSLKKHLDKICLNYIHNNTKNQIIVELNDQNITHHLKKHAVEVNVAEVSSNQHVRAKIYDLQKNLGINKEIIIDGRDIGTKIFPNAELKIFMTADIESRAHRMKNFYSDKHHSYIKKKILERDKLDQNRAHSPLIKPKNAIVIDTTHSTMEEQVNKIVELAKEKIHTL